MRAIRRNVLPVVLVLLLGESAMAQPTGCTASDDPAAIRQAEQKLVLLQRMVGSGGPAQRVDDGDNPEAKQVLEQARQEAAQASLVLDEGCADDAVSLVQISCTTRPSTGSELCPTEGTKTLRALRSAWSTPAGFTCKSTAWTSRCSPAAKT